MEKLVLASLSDVLSLSAGSKHGRESHNRSLWSDAEPLLPSTAHLALQSSLYENSKYSYSQGEPVS